VVHGARGEEDDKVSVKLCLERIFTGGFKEKWGIEKFLCKWWIKIAGE
jgi:hypothetical protein